MNRKSGALSEACTEALPFPLHPGPWFLHHCISFYILELTPCEELEGDPTPGSLTMW